MKITVLGRGNAGCLTALHFAYYARNRKDISIELLYDPNIPPEKVGQATLLEPSRLLWFALGINWYNNPIQATPKFGILYENWGKKNHKFIHPFPLGTAALHYAPAKLQETILKSKYFKTKEKHITDYSEIDSDFIFDCRGRRITNWKDYKILTNPLNAVLLGEGKSKECDINWTRAVATPDGWTFVIPNTTRTTSYGYLYNDKITPIKKAAANFKKLFNLAKQGIYLNEKVDNFKFKNYICKKPILDNRIILSGNRLFFLEPLESTAIASYLTWARLVWDWIIDKKVGPELITKQFHTIATQTQNFILWHYMYGSKYNTPFWKKAKKFKIKDPLFNRTLVYAKRSSRIELLDPSQDINNDLYASQWGPYSFKCWHDGMTK
jgi:hypothetical protein|tara:strand:- start:433 stop:1575 length:1143 start_codon:yes stop_codon:yes gene_type:complete